MSSYLANKKKNNCLNAGVDVDCYEFLHDGKVKCKVCNLIMVKTAPTQLKRHLETKNHINNLNNPIIDLSCNPCASSNLIEEHKEHVVKTLPSVSSLPVNVDFIINATNQMAITYQLELEKKDEKIKELENKIKELENKDDEIILKEPFKAGVIDIEKVKNNIKVNEVEYESEEEVIIEIDKKDKRDFLSDEEEENIILSECDEESDEESDEEPEITKEQQHEQDKKDAKKIWQEIKKNIKKENLQIQLHENFNYRDVLKFINKDLPFKQIKNNFTNPKWVKTWNKEKKEEILFIQDSVREKEKELKELEKGIHEKNKHVLLPQIEELKKDIEKLQELY
jgi:hypothetical protein